jgi:hypothetical protein
MALVDPRSGREADLPGPTGRPAGHQVSPPLAWLPGSDQPAKQAGTAQPEPHRISTVRPGGGACRARLRRGRGAQPWNAAEWPIRSAAPDHSDIGWDRQGCGGPRPAEWWK